VFDHISSIEILPLEDVSTSGTVISWDSSFVKKVPFSYLQIQQSSNGNNILIPGGVELELKKHLIGEEIYKYEIIQKIINDNGTYFNPNQSINYSTDHSVVDLAKTFDGLPFSGDYGVIAYARSLGIKSVYIIDEEELEKNNGLNNFEEIYRKKVGREEKKLINEINKKT
jgi:hypothetical protein